MFDIDYYELPDGSKPVELFLDSLNDKLAAKTLRNISLLEKNGNRLGMPFSKHLEDGIFELRTEQGSDLTRVLYFFIIGEKAVLTHGFVKKTQKTPHGEIERAKKYRHDYLSRRCENE